MIQETPVGVANIEQMLQTVYEPELADPAFVQNVEEHLLFTAHQLAQARIKPTPAENPPVDAARLARIRKRCGWALTMAASIAACMIGWYASIRFAQPHAQHQPEAQARDLEAFPAHEKSLGLTPSPRPAAAKSRALAIGETLATRGSERRRVTLADGSILYVNQNTVVEQTASRRLDVRQGEIYLEVQPSAKDRFLVTTPSGEVTALGTRFAVNVDGAESGVVVTQGKVQVKERNKRLVIVEAGQQATAGETSVAQAPRVSHVLDWTRELMTAACTPLVPGSKHAGGALIAIDPNGQEIQLTLRKYLIDVHIEDGFARTTIDQTYFNNENSRLEGTFYFPLPPDATLSRLAMYVENGKECVLMEGGMAERDHARNVYEEIRHTRRDPALLEWVDGSTFKMRVFPLEPRKEKRVLLSYTQRLPMLYGAQRYRFPAGHNMELVRNWQFQAVIKNGAKYLVTSESHGPEAENGRAEPRKRSESADQAARPVMEIKPEGDDYLARVAAQNIKPNQDVTLEIYEVPGQAGMKERGPGAGLDPRLKRKRGIAEQARFSAFVHEGNQYLMLRFQPALLKAEPRRERRDWVILFESGANRDPLLARAQIEIVRTLLENAEHDDTFSILTAGTRVRHFDTKTHTPSTQSIEEAVRFLEATHLIGAVDLEKGLNEAKQLLDKLENPHLLHVGAGSAAMGERREEVLAKMIPSSVRYVGVGVGKRWSRAFMKQAAERTSGLLTQINPDEPIAWKTFEMLATLNTPRLLEIEVSEGDTQARFLTEMTSLSQGEELCAVARLAGSDSFPRSVTVRGKMDGALFSRDIAVENVTLGAGYLPRQWAKLELERLLAEDSTKNKQAIIELSKASYVMSPFTSLLVLETEADYAKFKVDRGRKDHWAMYACPDRMPAPPYERETAHSAEPVKKTGEKTVKDVMESILVRVPAKLMTTTTGMKLSMTAWQACGYGEIADRSHVDYISFSVGFFHGDEKDGLSQKSGASDYELFLEGIMDAPRVQRRPGPTRYVRGNANTDAINLEGVVEPFLRGGGKWVTLEPLTEFERKSKQDAKFLESYIGYRAFKARVEPDNISEGWIGQRATYGAMFYRRQAGEYGATYADGDYAFTGRWSGLPIYQNDPFRGAGQEFRLEARAGIGEFMMQPRIDKATQIEVDEYIRQRNEIGNIIRQWRIALRNDADKGRTGLTDAQREQGRKTIIEAHRRLEDLDVNMRKQLRNDVGRFNTAHTLNFKSRLGLESDDWSSNRTFSFMEQPLWSDFGTEINSLIGRIDAGSGLVKGGIGEPARVGRIYIAGNDVTQDRAILRMLNTGQFRYPELELGKASLMRSNLFEMKEDAAPPTVEIVHSANLLYQRPSFTNDPRIFCDLLQYAPGLNTNSSDILGVLDAELPSCRKPGSVDPAARRLIDRARSLGWMCLTVGDKKNPLKIRFSASGQFCYERTTAGGLLEQVVCDGEELLHLYPEIGLGARRSVNRFHRAGLVEQLPWLVPPADDLAHGCDVQFIDEQTVALVPCALPDKTSSTWRMLLVFAGDGRLSQRQLVSGKGKVLYRETYLENGTIHCEGEERTTFKLDLAPCDEPDLAPDTARLVLVPMPIRSSAFLNSKSDGKQSSNEAIQRIVAHSLEGSANLAYEVIWSHFYAKGDHRLGFMTLLSAASAGSHGNSWWTERWNDRFSGIKKMYSDSVTENPGNPLARYLFRVNKFLAGEWGDKADEQKPQSGLVPRLAAFFDHYHYVPRLSGKEQALQKYDTPDWPKAAMEDPNPRSRQSPPLGGSTFNPNPPLGAPAGQFPQPLVAPPPDLRSMPLDDAEWIAYRDRILAYVKTCPSAVHAWIVLDQFQSKSPPVLVQGRAVSDPVVHRAAAEVFERLESETGLVYIARYERARSLWLAGDHDKARALFSELYRDAVKAGALPPIDAKFIEALKDDFAPLVRESSARFAREKQVRLNLLLARQLWQLGQTEPASEACDLALSSGQKAIEELAVRLRQELPASEKNERFAQELARALRANLLWAGLEHYRQTSQPARAEPLLEQLLGVVDNDPALWRLAAELAQKRGNGARCLFCLEKAMDLEYQKLPEVVNLQSIRQEYGQLLTQYQQLATSLNILQSTPPKDFLAKVVKTADRWRMLDPEPDSVCQQTAKILRTLGARDLAWDYLTTPIGLKPNESAPWLSLAGALAGEGDLDLADRAFAAAYQAEPTNPHILWDRARNLRRLGRTEQAGALERQIAEGSWQPRFQWLRDQVRRNLNMTN